jgi:hypothetical protein
MKKGTQQTAEYETVPPAAVPGSLNDVETKYALKTFYLAGDRTLLRHGPRVSIATQPARSDEYDRELMVSCKNAATHLRRSRFRAPEPRSRHGNRPGVT